MAHHFTQTAGQMATQMVPHLLPSLAVKPAPKANPPGWKAPKNVSKSGSATPRAANATPKAGKVAPNSQQVANPAAPSQTSGIQSSGQDIDRFKVAQDAWADVFHRNAYTNFSQINYLKDKAGVSWDDLMKEPTILKARVTKEAIEADTSFANVLTWSRSGRCTSFAVAVVRRLEEYYPDIYDFKYYNLKGHRVARCASSGILIDSSSTRGAIVLPDGADWVTFENALPSWKWSTGTSRFVGENGQKVSLVRSSASFPIAHGRVTRCVALVRH
jgi:hypothetical protein